MKKSRVNSIFFFLIVIILSCKREVNKDFINKAMKIETDTIRKIELNRGILKMMSFRNTIYMHSWCSLEYKYSFPSWIEDKHKPDFSFKNYVFKPCISDIELPYEIFKNDNENYFYIIKNKDTLKFKIVD